MTRLSSWVFIEYVDPLYTGAPDMMLEFIKEFSLEV